MENINLLTISSELAFSSSLRKFFSSYINLQVINLSSLDDPLPPSIERTRILPVIDLDSLDEDPLNLLARLRKVFPDIPLVLVTAKRDSLHLAETQNLYIVDRDALHSSLFPDLLRALFTLDNLTHQFELSQSSLKKQINKLGLIRKAGLHLTMNLSLDAVLQAILDSAMELVSAEDTHVFLYEHGVLSFASALFGGHQQNEPFLHPRQNGVTYLVAREGKKKVINDTLKDPLFEDRPWKGAIISLPLKIGQKVLGVMNVALKKAYVFSDGEINVLEFLADQAAIAIQNAKLYEQAQQEIADRKKAEKAIQHLANHDTLTGLPNRRLFNERINLEIARSERNQKKFSVMLFDLDHLKFVNDSYGHNLGDMLLQAVAQRLLGLLRKSDTIARMGGDEFLLILPEINREEDALLTAQRILTALSTPFHLEGFQVNITTSIGISYFPRDGEKAESLIKKADLSMYKAKEKGGNTYHVYIA